jgi:hypothetical protein
MSTSGTFTFSNTSGGNWSSSGNWSAAAGSTGFATTAAGGANAQVFILSAQTGAYTVTVDLASIFAGAVEIDSSNATIAVGSSRLGVGAAAVTTGAGGTLTINNGGTVTLNGGTLAYYQTTLNAGRIIGSGTITSISTGSTLFTNNTLSASGGSVIASGGTLTVNGTGNAPTSLLTASGNFALGSAGAALTFGPNTGLVQGSSFDFGGLSGTLTSTNQTTGSLAQFHSVGTVFVFNANLKNFAIGSTANNATGASVITLSGVSLTSASIVTTNSANDTLKATTTGGTYEWVLSSGSFTGDYAFFSGGSVWVDAVCYAAGTSILTESGERLVEDLAVGDRLITPQGAMPVKWIGRRRVDLARHPRPADAAPVRIHRNAFGVNEPHRDLVLSPEHCVFADGRLIPAKSLVNGMTVVQELATPSIEYFHIELERHGLLYAEGLLAESYLDTGNRAFFANAGLALVLHPEFTVNAGLKCWETDACAPLASDAEIEPVWHRLAARAEELGYQPLRPETTDEPDLRIVAGTRSIRPVFKDATRCVFALPAGVTGARLVSRTAVPIQLGTYSPDSRQLGVAVRRITVRDGASCLEMPADHPLLARGWYAAERNGTAMWRWTDGDAALPLPAAEAPLMVEIHLAMAARYIAKLEPPAAERLAA